jgi:predicted amidohydrolase YtcJ
MRSAVDRRTASGAVVVSSERISGWRALDLFGGTAPIRAGAYADLVLLGVPLASAIDRLQSSDVVLTAIGGDVVYDGR